jgi:exosome complex component CSL4
MANRRIKDGDHVLPGERLGVIEEFIPGAGTFQDQDDAIYANITGNVHINMKERKISVESTTRTPLYPQRNDIVFGEIQSVSKKSATINIFRIRDVPCPVPFSAFLYIKESVGGYVDQMQDLFAPGDIILARVQQQSEGLTHLSTVGSRFGVLRAYCSRCGEPLSLKGARLECPQCGNVEKRKLANSYGKGSDTGNADEHSKPSPPQQG